MTIDIADVLTRVPDETFMLVPLGDVNSIFFLRNSLQGRAFLDRWLKMGIEDGGAPCRHKFGCWEYHDQGWWFVRDRFGPSPSVCKPSQTDFIYFWFFFLRDFPC